MLARLIISRNNHDGIMVWAESHAFPLPTKSDRPPFENDLLRRPASPERRFEPAVSASTIRSSAGRYQTLTRWTSVMGFLPWLSRRERRTARRAASRTTASSLRALGGSSSTASRTASTTTSCLLRLVGGVQQPQGGQLGIAQQPPLAVQHHGDHGGAVLNTMRRRFCAGISESQPHDAGGRRRTAGRWAHARPPRPGRGQGAAWRRVGHLHRLSGTIGQGETGMLLQGGGPRRGPARRCAAESRRYISSISSRAG